MAWTSEENQPGSMTQGTPTKSMVKIDKTRTYTTIEHTHPAENPSPFTAMPSKQDLETLIKNIDNVKKFYIYSGDYFTTIEATRPKPTVPAGYENTLKEAANKNNIKIIIEKLEQAGFNIGVGARNA